MNFEPGEYLVHQKFGVGVIISIEEMNFTEAAPRLFYHVDFSKATVWIPVEDQPTAKLRRVVSKDHLPHYCSVLKSTPAVLDQDFRKRQYSLNTRASLGTFQESCEIIRDLNALSFTKPLNSFENRLFSRIWDALVLEWSTASGQSHSETIAMINNWLPKKGQSSKL